MTTNNSISRSLFDETIFVTLVDEEKSGWETYFSGSIILTDFREIISQVTRNEITYRNSLQ